jgi:hypothetical protein
MSKITNEKFIHNGKKNDNDLTDLPINIYNEVLNRYDNLDGVVSVSDVCRIFPNSHGDDIVSSIVKLESSGKLIRVWNEPLWDVMGGSRNAFFIIKQG